MSKKQKTYAVEFKAEAIESYKVNISETAQQLGFSMQTFSNWYNKA